MRLADEFAETVREAERCLLAQFFLNPAGGWNASVKAKLVSNDFAFSEHTELFEYVCQDNNLASGLMIGQEVSVDRNSVIVP